MSSFYETLETMHQLLRGEKSPEEVAEIFGADPNRLAIYQGFVKGHIAKTLEKNYCLLKRTILPEIWKKLVDQYFTKYPALDWRLNESTEKFPFFLQDSLSQKDLQLNEFHVELAKFEWEEVNIFNTDATIPSPTQIDQLILNPTISILQFTYPIAEFVKQIRVGKKNKWLEEKKFFEEREQEEIVFLFRNLQTYRCNFLQGNDNILFAFKVVHENLSLSQAAEATGQEISIIKQIIREVSQTGLIILPKNF